jgi:peptidoglycan/LPS O-acetylase OafA/YrhL
MKHVRSIDGLRGIAVLGVLIPHLIGDSITTEGARGVDLFFVISGFCLGLSALERGFHPGAFALARARRILPPYYAAILLDGIIAVCNGRLTLRHTVIEGLRNVFFMSEQSLSPPINGGFWTLFIEFRWYAYFPLLLALYLWSKPWFAILMGICAANAKWGPAVLPDTDIVPAFMLGIVAADFTLRKTPLPGLTAAAIGVSTITLICDRDLLHVPYLNHGNFLWQAAFFVILLAGIRSWVVPLTVAPLAFLGRISYSLYLAQGSALELLSPYHISPWLAAPAVIMYSYLFYLLFEKRVLFTSCEKIIVDRITLCLR